MRVRIAAALGAAAVLIGLLLIPAQSDSPPPTPSSVPPLVVLITVDALRADHLGVYGYARPTSPYIDALAREAVVVEDAIANAPYTKASIASLMTGLYPSAHKTYTVSATVADSMDGDVEEALPRTDVLPRAATTLAEALDARGYVTAAFTTNPFLIADFGFAQGFDSFRFLSAEGFAAADEVLGRALRAIESETRPLFVWVHLMEPHSPYTPDEVFRRVLPPTRPPRLIPPDVSVPPYLAETPTRDVRVYESLYDAEIRSVDAALGCFFDALRGRPAWDDTVIVLTSDHGEQFLEHGGLEHNTNLHDELLRVPLIVRAPNLAPRRVDAQVQLVDVLPTIVGMAGGAAPPRIHGRDLQPLLRGEPFPAAPALAERVGEQYAVRTREWKLIAGAEGGRELYALARDPGERHSLMHPVRIAEMEEILQGLLTSAIENGEGIRAELGPLSPDSRKRLESLGYVK